MPRKKKTETKEETKQIEEKGEEQEVKEEKDNGFEEQSEEKPKKEKTESEEVEIKKEIEKTKQKLLVPLEEYLECGVHIGTRVITPSMRQYIYRRKADGLAVIDTTKIDEKLKQASEFISQYSPEDIIIVCKREAGWKSIEAFSRASGIRTFTKKYPAGIITNPDLENFFEPKLVVISDPWLDKNALHDAVKIHVPIIALCDTNNNTDYADFVIPCNNKTNKSISLIFYVLTILYCKNQGIKVKINKDDFYKIIKEEKKE